jgi:hypothetical protein
LEIENAYLHEQVKESFAFGEIVGKDPSKSASASWDGGAH